MTHRRLTLLTCSMVASFAMTACGGGDGQGPTWAQDLKTTINPPGTTAAVKLPPQASLASLVPGEYRGACEALRTGAQNASILVLTVTREGNDTYVTKRQDLYDNPSCTDDALLGSATQPVMRLTLDSEATDAASGQRFLKVNASSAGGNVVFKAEPEAPLTIDTSSSTTTKLVFESWDDTLELPSKAAASVVKDVYALIGGSLYRGNDDSRQPAGSGFATQLNLNVPYKPFKLLDVVPGTYGGECQAQDFGTGRLYGVLAKDEFLPKGEDQKVRFITSLEVYDQPECIDTLLYIVKYPTVSVDTVGNNKVNISDDATQPLTVDARQVILNYPAGTVEVILDQEAQTNGLISVSQGADGPVVTFPADKNNKLTYRSKSAETVKSLRYAAGPLVFFGDPDPQTADPVTNFPTKLLQNTPLSLIP
jgi:hypothetical protein